MPPRVPPLVWVSIVLLGIISMIQLLVGLGRGNVPLLVAVGLNLGLMVGLHAGRKWAYVALIVISGLGVLAQLGNSLAAVFGVLLINSLVVTPVVFSTDYFWPRRDRDPAEAG